jgi:hypothetical protein
LITLNSEYKNINREKIQEEIEKINKTLSKMEKIKKFKNSY